MHAITDYSKSTTLSLEINKQAEQIQKEFCQFIRRDTQQEGASWHSTSLNERSIRNLKDSGKTFLTLKHYQYYQKNFKNKDQGTNITSTNKRLISNLLKEISKTNQNIPEDHPIITGLNQLSKFIIQAQQEQLFINELEDFFQNSTEKHSILKKTSLTEFESATIQNAIFNKPADNTQYDHALTLLKKHYVKKMPIETIDTEMEPLHTQPASAPIEKSISNPCVTVKNGLYTWTVYNWDQQDHKTLVSNPFYFKNPSNDKNYKFSIKLYPTGDQNGKNSHISIYFTLLDHIDDELNIFPFLYRIGFSLSINTKKIKQIFLKDFSPSPTCPALRRPIEHNSKYSLGADTFFPLEKIKKYICNNKLTITMLISEQVIKHYKSTKTAEKYSIN